MNKYKKKFFQYSRMKRAKAFPLPPDTIDEITICIFNEGQSNPEGCFTFRWVYVNNDLTCRLEVLEEAFRSLVECFDLIRELGGYGQLSVTPIDLYEILIKLGYQDTSNEKSNYDIYL